MSRAGEGFASPCPTARLPACCEGIGEAREAGFESSTVVRRNLEPFAREAGVREEHLAFFAGPGARFLLGRKG